MSAAIDRLFRCLAPIDQSMNCYRALYCVIIDSIRTNIPGELPLLSWVFFFASSFSCLSVCPSVCLSVVVCVCGKRGD